ERVALIGTYRTDDLHRRHPLRPVVAELLRLPGVIAVDLVPLAPSALAEHLTAAAQGRIGATELNGIVARAEGNAYYAEELLAASLSGDRQEQSLPAGLAALLLSRVEQLSDAAQRGGWRCYSAGWSSSPPPPSRCSARRRWPAVKPTTSWSRPRRAWCRPTTRPPCGRPSRASCSCPTAPRATCSGTPCCARPSTVTCCRASAPGCTAR